MLTFKFYIAIILSYYTELDNCFDINEPKRLTILANLSNVICLHKYNAILLLVQTLSELVY